MNNPAVFIKEPLCFKNKFKVYPPSVRDVVGNPKYAQYIKLLTISQDDIQDEMAKKIEEGKPLPTPFEFLLINCYHSAEFRQVAIEAFEFFLHEQVNFFYEQKMLVIGKLEQVVTKIEKVEDLITI